MKEESMKIQMEICSFVTTDDSMSMSHFFTTYMYLDGGIKYEG